MVKYVVGGIALAASGFALKKFLDSKIKEKYPNLEDYELEDYEEAFMDTLAKGMRGTGEYAQDFGKWLKAKASELSDEQGIRCGILQVILDRFLVCDIICRLCAVKLS